MFRAVSIYLKTTRIPADWDIPRQSHPSLKVVAQSKRNVARSINERRTRWRSSKYATTSPCSIQSDEQGSEEHAFELENALNTIRSNDIEHKYYVKFK